MSAHYDKCLPKCQHIMTNVCPNVSTLWQMSAQMSAHYDKCLPKCQHIMTNVCPNVSTLWQMFAQMSAHYDKCLPKCQHIMTNVCVISHVQNRVLYFIMLSFHNGLTPETSLTCNRTFSITTKHKQDSQLFRTKMTAFEKLWALPVFNDNGKSPVIC